MLVSSYHIIKDQKINLVVEINKIKHCINKELLNSLLMDIYNNEKTLIDVATMYGFNVDAFKVLYLNFIDELKVKEKKTNNNSKKKKVISKPIEDKYYNTGSLIRNLKIYVGADNKKKLKVYYNDPNIECTVVDATKENRVKYLNKAMRDGKKMFNTIDNAIRVAGGICRTEMSRNEELLYKKWHLYLKKIDQNQEVIKAIKDFDSVSKEVIKEKIITYKKLNSLNYDLKSLKNDLRFVETFYNNRIVNSHSKSKKK